MRYESASDTRLKTVLITLSALVKLCQNSKKIKISPFSLCNSSLNRVGVFKLKWPLLYFCGGKVCSLVALKHVRLVLGC